jgi:hypothetical protein
MGFVMTATFVSYMLSISRVTQNTNVRQVKLLAAKSSRFHEQNRRGARFLMTSFRKLIRCGLCHEQISEKATNLLAPRLQADFVLSPLCEQEKPGES